MVLIITGVVSVIIYVICVVRHELCSPSDGRVYPEPEIDSHPQDSGHHAPQQVNTPDPQQLGNARTISVCVRNFLQMSLIIDVDGNSTVLQLKSAIYYETRIPINDQLLAIGGINMRNNDKLTRDSVLDFLEVWLITKSSNIIIQRST